MGGGREIHEWIVACCPFQDSGIEIPVKQAVFVGRRGGGRKRGREEKREGKREGRRERGERKKGGRQERKEEGREGGKKEGREGDQKRWERIDQRYKLNGEARQVDGR